MHPRPPGGGVHDGGLLRIPRQVHGAGRIAGVEDVLPVFPAVGREEDPALRVRAEHVTQRRDEHAIRIGGVYQDRTDVSRQAEPGVGPGLAPVGGAIDAVARHDVPARVYLPGAGVEDLGIGGRDGPARRSPPNAPAASARAMCGRRRSSSTRHRPRCRSSRCSADRARRPRPWPSPRARGRRSASAGPGTRPGERGRRVQSWATPGDADAVLGPERRV